jgi:hypothetical protein
LGFPSRRRPDAGELAMDLASHDADKPCPNGDRSDIGRNSFPRAVGEMEPPSRGADLPGSLSDRIILVGAGVDKPRRIPAASGNLPFPSWLFDLRPALGLVGPSIELPGLPERPRDLLAIRAMQVPIRMLRAAASASPSWFLSIGSVATASNRAVLCRQGPYSLVFLLRPALDLSLTVERAEALLPS